MGRVSRCHGSIALRQDIYFDGDLDYPNFSYRNISDRCCIVGLSDMSSLRPINAPPSRRLIAALLLALPLLAQAQSLESARRLKQQGSLRSALQAYEALLPGLRSASDYPQALLELSQTALALGEYPRAIEAGAQAAGLFHQRADAENESLAANTVGLSRLYRGEYPPALRSFERSLQLDRDGHDGKGEITRLSNIGNVYFFQGKYLDALQSYQFALRRRAGAHYRCNAKRGKSPHMASVSSILGPSPNARSPKCERFANWSPQPCCRRRPGRLLSKGNSVQRSSARGLRQAG